MAITVDYLTQVINVPQADLTFVSGTLYELDTEAFRLILHGIQDSEEGIAFDDFFRHNTEVTVAGTTYARTIEIINGYTVQFEDGQYAVRLVGSNNNIFDEGVLVRNQVSVIPTNSAGLQTVDLTTLELLVDELHKLHGLDAANVLEITDTSRSSGGVNQTLSDDGTTSTVTRT